MVAEKCCICFIIGLLMAYALFFMGYSRHFGKLWESQCAIKTMSTPLTEIFLQVWLYNEGLGSNLRVKFHGTLNGQIEAHKERSYRG